MEDVLVVALELPRADATLAELSNAVENALSASLAHNVLPELLL
jgi:hypothetical protein